MRASGLQRALSDMADAIARPDRLFRRLEQTENPRAVILPAVLGSLGVLKSVFWLSEKAVPWTRSALALALADLPLAVLWWLGVVAVFHAVARIAGAKGSYVKLLKFLGYMAIPAVIYHPLSLPAMRLGVLSPPGSALAVGAMAFLVAGSLAAGAWAAILAFKAVRYAYGLNGKAVGITVAGYVALQLLSLLILTAVISPPVHVSGISFSPMSARVTTDNQWDRVFDQQSGFNLGFGAAVFPVEGGLRRGDVILVPSAPLKDRPPYGRSVVRVAGLPGESVEIRDGRVIIDGSPLPEPDAIPGSGLARLEGRTFTLGPDDYFVLGDNRQLAPDTYGGGLVAGSTILGRLPVLEMVLFRMIVR